MIIHVNESIHHDLYLADRIRLITILTSAEALAKKGVVEEYEFDYTNDTNDASPDGYTHILSRDIFGADAVNPGTVIVKLKNTERVCVTVRTVVGVGATHSKHYPVAPASFHLTVEQNSINDGEEDDSDDELPLYDFTVDSTRTLSAETVLESAVDIVLAKLGGVRAALEAEVGRPM